MGIGSRDNAVLERVSTKHLLKAHAVDQRPAHVAVVHLADLASGAEQVLEQLEVGKLIVGRQGRVGIRLTLGLDDLGRNFVFHAPFGPLAVYG